MRIENVLAVTWFNSAGSACNRKKFKNDLVIDMEGSWIHIREPGQFGGIILGVNEIAEFGYILNSAPK